MYAYTTGARSYEEEPEAMSLLLATSSSPSTSSTSASAVGPVFDSCRKKRTIIRFGTLGRDASTYERRATSEAVSVRRASIVRTALRPIRTKNTLVDWMDLNATRTTYRRACHAAPFFLLLRRGAVLREGLHGIRCKRESAQLARLVTEI